MESALGTLTGCASVCERTLGRLNLSGTAASLSIFSYGALFLSSIAFLKDCPPIRRLSLKQIKLCGEQDMDRDNLANSDLALFVFSWNMLSRPGNP